MVWTVVFGLFIAQFSRSQTAAPSRAENLTHTGNPIFPGWYADPEGVVFGKQFWIYPTYSAPYGQQVFLDAFSSPDLANWKKHSRILDTNAVTWARRAMWAPAIVHEGDRYFLFFAANDIQRDGEVGGIGVAVADKPEGPFADYLGKPLIDRFHNGAQPIDQFVFSRQRWSVLYDLWRLAALQHRPVEKRFSRS